ncbi:MAG TPA: TIGR01777 family oxidoreductase, partial [Actinomycetes bacterium]|nr:TIGR01777 family oxidoreductase [Actinomycetes bacterium]
LEEGTMLVAVTGASGLIGTALARRLEAEGHQVLRLTRSRPTGPGQVQWDPAAGRLDPDALAKADAVVHLAGAGIGDRLRWTAKVKREILRSRVEGTALVARTMAELARGSGGGPRVLVSASGAHYYGDRGDEVLTEASGPGEGFLAGVVRQWEAAADPARDAGLRVVHLRTTPVQDASGAGLQKQALLFRLGLGGRFGSGRQWLSWIGLDDIAGAYLHALTRDDLAGPVNAAAPNPVTNAEFTATLARVLRRPAVLHVPAFAPRLVLGEFADEMLFASIRAVPSRLIESGYRFRFPELEGALRHTLGRPARG